jgi:hypothetical protein
VRVEVLHVPAQHDVEVTWSSDQKVVEAFPAQGSDEAFPDRVRPGARIGARMTRMSAHMKTASNAVAVFAEVHEQVAGR